MECEEIKDKIVDILDITFQVIDQCYINNDEAGRKANFYNAGSRIIFPSYNNAERRISEQELRFLFIEKFNQYCQLTNWDAYYSVETPTKDTYRFPKKGEPEQANDGRSARIDVCIHNNKGKRLCMIEFKALNPSKNSYKKDLYKLSNEKNIITKDPSYNPNDGLVCFFVQLLENRDKATSNNILRKIDNNLVDSYYVCHTIGLASSTESPKTQYLPNNSITRKGWEIMRSEKDNKEQ